MGLPRRYAPRNDYFIKTFTINKRSGQREEVLAKSLPKGEGRGKIDYSILNGGDEYGL